MLRFQLEAGASNSDSKPPLFDQGTIRDRGLPGLNVAVGLSRSAAERALAYLGMIY